MNEGYLQDNYVTRKALRVITCDAKQADEAFAVYAAMKRAEITEPMLLQISMWQSFRALAFAMFMTAFEVAA